MKKILATLAVTIGLVLSMGSPAEAAKRPVLYVQGDSISDWYNDTPGDAERGWWSWTADKVKARKTVVDAIGGTGMATRHGNGCKEKNFKERLSNVVRHRPDILIVEGGRNDWRQCGRAGYLSKSQIKKNVKIYMNALARTAKRAGMKPNEVYVMNVWGTNLMQHRDRVRPYMKRYAERKGFHYLNVNLSKSQSYDGTHPNYKGSMHIYKKVRGWVAR